MRLWMLMLTCQLLTAPLAYAAEDTARTYAQGAAHLSQGNWAQAAEAFEHAAERGAQSPKLFTLLGMARYHLQQYPAAVTALQHGLAAGTPYEARALYYLGLSHSALDQTSAASRAFAQLLERHPASEEAARLLARRQQATPGDAPKQPDPGWRVYGRLELGWDNNPQRAPDNLDRDAQADDDGFALATLVGRQVLGTQLELMADAFWKDYLDSNANDFAGLGLSASSKQEQPSGTWKPQMSLRCLWLDRHFYQAQGSLDLTWEQSLADRWQGSLKPALAYKHHNSDYEHLDGAEAGLDARVTWKPTTWNRVKRLRIDLAGNYYDPERGSSGWLEWETELDLRWQLPGPWSADSAVALRCRAYHEARAGRSSPREDLRTTYAIGCRRRIGRQAIFTGSATYRRNHSNIDAYDYDQLVVSLGLAGFF